MKKIYKNINILDGTKDMELQENKMLIIEDGRIQSILDNDDNIEGIDCQNKYLIPGLINLHVHTPGNGFPKKKETDSRKLAQFVMSNPITRIYAKSLCKKSIQTHLLSGTTTIRTVGGLGHIDSMIRNDINNHKYDGPRVISCDNALTVAGGHMEGSVAFGAGNKDEFINHILDNKKHNVDWIKLMITGGVLDAKVKGEPGEMKMTPEQIKLCTDKAHELGLKVCAHVESPEGIKIALENNVDCIEHGSYIDDEVIELFKEKNATLICTLSPAIPLAKFDPNITKANDIVLYNAEYLFNGMVNGVKKCIDNNIIVGVGTDTVCPYITHYDLWRELEYIHKFIGLSRKDVLYLATLNNAQIVGIDNITGSIEKNKLAEFVILDENPLNSFNTIRKPYMVVKENIEIINPQINKSKEAELLLDEYLLSIS